MDDDDDLSKGLMMAALAEWAQRQRGRDDLVRRALQVGISKRRIHLATGIARSTIDRIASPARSTTPDTDSDADRGLKSD